MNFRSQILLFAFSVFLLVSWHSIAHASSGYFDFFLDVTKPATAWNFERANSVTLGAGEWAHIRINSKWQLASGCWPGSDAPRCSSSGHLAAANTTVIWEAVGCPTGATCMMYTNHDADNNHKLTWGIVPNFYYQPYLSVKLSPQTPTGRYPIVFLVREHPTSCRQSGGSCIPEQSQTFYLDVVNIPRSTIAVEPQAMSFSGTKGSIAPAAQTFRLLNQGTATMNWNAFTNQAWCKIGKSSGSLSPGENENISVFMDVPTNVGNFSCTIVITDPAATNNPVQLPVVYSVSPKSSVSVKVASLKTLDPGKALVADVRAGLAINVYGSDFDPVITNNQLYLIRNSDSKVFTSNVTGLVPGGLRFNLPSHLGVGRYSVQIINQKDSAGLRSNSLTFDILPDIPRPRIGVEPFYLNFNSALTQPAPEAKYLTLKNDGDGVLSWKVISSRDWCHIEKISGSVPSGSFDRIRVSVDTPSNTGEFDCFLEFIDSNSPNSPYTYLVHYSVSPKPRPYISLSTHYLGFNAVVNSPSPQALSLEITNTGTAVLNWSATSNEDWCHLSKSSGVVQPKKQEEILVYVDKPSRIGNFDCKVKISDLEASNNPRFLTINYQVRPAASRQSVSLKTSSLTCGTVSLVWESVGGASGFNLFKSAQDLVPSFPFAYNVSGSSYVDKEVSSLNRYYYWIQAVGSSVKYPALSNSLGGVYPKTCSTVPQPVSGLTVSTQTCGQAALRWNPLSSDIQGVYIYRTTQDKRPASNSLLAQLRSDQMEYVDMPSEGDYTYWVAAYNSFGFAEMTSVTTRVSSCSADLAFSDKNLIAINGLKQNTIACDKNTFQGLPEKSKIRQGDVLTFEINLCNLIAHGNPAKDVLVTDKLYNLTLPPAGWNLKINNKPARLVNEIPKIGEYRYNNLDRTLEINVGTVRPGGVTQVSYDAQVTPEGSTVCPKCQNTAKVNFKTGGNGDKQLNELILNTPYIYFNL